MRLKWGSPILFLRALGRALVYRIRGRRVIAPEKEMERRESKCLVCPHYADGQCKLCTCFVSVKVMLSSESCPDNPPRWRRLH